MDAEIEISDLKGARRIWMGVAVGTVLFAVLILSVMLASRADLIPVRIFPGEAFCAIGICVALAALMWIPLHFMNHTVLLSPEGICKISQAKWKVVPWLDVAGARAAQPSTSTSKDHRARLFIDLVDGSTCEETRLRFGNQETADAINRMKEVYGRANPAPQMIGSPTAPRPER